MLLARVLASALLALTAVGCTSSETVQRGGSAEVVELTSLSTLKTAFAEGDGEPRLLLLLSPT